MRKLFTFFSVLLATSTLWAYNFQSGDLYYNITSDSTVAVTYQEYNSSSNYASIYTVTVPETITYDGTTYNVTSIGSSAFRNCSSLISVTIPNSVTSIGGSAFRYCSSLAAVTIPNSVTNIGAYTFYECSSLETITIPYSITSIGARAFQGCSSITSVVWNAHNCADPKIYHDAPFYFIGSQITSFIFGDSVKHIPASLCHSMTAVNTITIPNSVTSIGQSAFSSCSSLSSITIPESVTNIGNSAFYGCSSLTSITIPESVTSIGQSAFSSCSSLSSITIPESVTSIGQSAFSSCSSLTSITIPESVTSIGNYVFRYCSSLTSITIPNSVTSIGNQVFEDCHSLVSIAIGKNLTSIGTDIFESCYSLSSIKIDNDNIYYDSRENCNAIIKTETNALLYGCRSTTIPNSVTSIEKNAFKNCSSLTSIIIPNSVTSIGNSAFYGTTFTKDNFINNSSLDAEVNNYWGARIVEQEIQDLLINGKTVVDCRPHATIVSIPDTITTIGGHAFADCPFLISVTIPNSVTSIEDYYAFGYCSSLTSINIPNSVTSIGYYAFRGCSSLTTIDIPNSLTEIAHGMFQDCSSLTTVTIPNSVTSIGQLAFDGCSSLTSITIPNSVISIGWNAFSGCRSLTAITIPESVTDIGSGAFTNCSSLTSVIWNAIKCGQAYYYDGYTHFEIELEDSTNYSYEEIGEFVKQFHLDEGNIINNSPFHGCDGIKSFSFGENVEFIPEGLCYGLDGITSITIPESVSSIGERSFGECSSLDTIYCYSKNLPIMYLTDLNVHIVNIGMIYTYDDADAPYIYDNTILYVPCQLLDAYKSQDEYSIRFPNIQCLEEDTPSQPQDQPTEGIGVFSVGEGKTVTFSPGNLQYTQSTNTWSFAENQWDMIGTDNITGGSVSSNLTYGDSKSGNALADKIDLFGWSTSATNFGVSTSKSTIDYSGSFVDWGTNQIGTDAPNTWRTLTGDEWYYLRYTRTNADALCGVAQVNGVNGLVFLPDNWTCPEGATFKSGFHSDNSKEAYGQYQTFTSEQWSKLEAAGAVFLSASGTRSGSTVNNVQYSSHYWSANEHNGDYARCLYFYSDEAGWGGFYRDAGRSVRLIKDISSTTPEPPTPSEPQDTTIYHPVDITICENDLPYIFTGRESVIELTEAGTYTYEEIVEEDNYIYHHIYTLELTVIAPMILVWPVEAYDSYEWHGVVYTESGTYLYEEWCFQEILELTIIPSEDKEYVYEHHNYLVCDADIFVDPITGENYLISSLVPTSLTWSDTVKGTEVDTIHTFNITPIVNPEPLTEDMLYAIGAVPKLVAGEKVDLMGTTDLIMTYYQMVDQHDIADVIGVEWVLGHDVVLDAEQTTHTMELEVWAQCDYKIPMEFTFPVSKKDSEPQDTTIYIYYTEDATICEGETYIWWMGKEYTETGTYTYAYEEIVEEDDYIYHYHHIYTLDLTVIAPMILVWPVEAYDSYEWHGKVYTESGVYKYVEWCYQEILELTIIPSTETAVDNMQTDSDHSAQKILRDGQLYIYHNGSAYTIMGQKVSENF